MINNLNGSLLAERNVLGSVLLDESCAPRVFSSLSEEAFSYVDKRNALVFRAMKALLDERKPIDITTVDAQLNTMQLSEECDSPKFIYELSENAIDPNNVDFYINTVRDYYTLRQYFDRLEAAKKDFNAGKVEDIGDFLNNTSTDLNFIANKRSVGSFRESKEVVDEVMTNLDLRRHRDNKKVTGLDTGYITMNDLIHGFQPGTLNIIGGRPGMGKTTLAINLMVNGAESLIGQGKTIAFFSCEMDAAKIMERLLSAKSMVPNDNIQVGNISEADNKKLIAACETLSKLPIYFDDTPNQYLGDIIAKCEKIDTSTKGKLAAVFIDYLNIIRVPISRANESRTLQIAMITSQLKELARRLKIPVILLAQLNRDADKNNSYGGKGTQSSIGPDLSSLKESSAIEQDADTIMMIYRNDWAGKSTATDAVSTNGNPTDPAKETFDQKLVRQVNELKAAGKDRYDISIMQVTLQKNRNGRTGKISLIYEKSIQLLSNPTVDLDGTQDD